VLFGVVVICSAKPVVCYLEGLRILNGVAVVGFLRVSDTALYAALPVCLLPSMFDTLLVSVPGVVPYTNQNRTKAHNDCQHLKSR
jgi:hypothetical protein